jgi:hypothetical protein
MYGTLKSLLVLAGKVGGFEIDSMARTTVLDAFLMFECRMRL